MNKENLKSKAKEKAGDVSGLNDTSIDAKLYLNGKEYAIDGFDIQFQQCFDHKGEPQRETKGGLLDITLNRAADEQLNHWMFHSNASFSGSVVFASFSRIANPVMTINFSGARCARYSKSLGSSISLKLLITAEEISVNGISHRNKW